MRDSLHVHVNTESRDHMQAAGHIAEGADLLTGDFCALHSIHLRAVMIRLQERKLYVKPTKCEWAQTEIEFLGHCVNTKGLSITHDKAQALQNWPVPTSIAEVCSVLGTFGFWRQYIKLYADIVEPLVALTRKATLWGWGESEQQSFERLSVRYWSRLC